MLAEEKKQVAALNQKMKRWMRYPGCMSLHPLILDNQFRWTGALDINELLNTIQRRDPTQLSAGALESMISDGNAYGLAEMMLKEGRIFPAFIDILTHETFSIRLGAMAAAEEIAERHMSLAAQMTVLLVEKFERRIDAIVSYCQGFNFRVKRAC